MTTENLESTKELEEQKPPTPEEKPSGETAEVSPAAPEEVSGDKDKPTFDEAQQEYIDRAVEEAKEAALVAGRSEGQSSKDRELQPLKDEIAELRKKERETSLSTLEQTLKEKYGDTPETKDLATAWRNYEDRKDELDKREEQVKAAEDKAASGIRGMLAFQLAKKYEGAEEKELLKAKTPEEMKDMARDAHIAFLKGKKPVAKKVDSGVPAAGGVDFSTVSFDPNAPSAREMIEKGVNKK